MRLSQLTAAVVLLTSLGPISMQGTGHAAEADVSMVGVASPGDRFWPRWRGPTGQGIGSGIGYPDRWSGSENVVWRIEVPGDGHSSPIVWGGRIYLTTSYDGGSQRSILAFDRNDGQLLWETSAPRADPERVYAKNNHASSTPTTDGERIYAYFGNHGLVAVDLDGRQTWHRDFGDVSTRHGTAGSPLLYADRIILFQDHDGPRGSFVAAYARESGKELWWTPRREHVGWGSAVAIRVDGRDEIVVSSQGRVYSYDPMTGAETWSCGGNLSEVTPTPVAGEGLLFCSSGRAGPTLAIRPGGSGDVTSTHIAWQTTKGSPFIPSPLLYQGRLYTINDMVSVASCHDARSGELLWQGRLGRAARESFSASPVAVDGKVFFTNDAGQTFVLRAGDEFELLHINDIGEQTLASPALVDGDWYIRTRKHLYRIGAS